MIRLSKESSFIENLIMQKKTAQKLVKWRKNCDPGESKSCRKLVRAKATVLLLWSRNKVRSFTSRRLHSSLISFRCCQRVTNSYGSVAHAAAGPVSWKTFDQLRRRPTSMHPPTSKAHHQLIFGRTVTNKPSTLKQSQDLFNDILFITNGQKNDFRSALENDHTCHRSKSIDGQARVDSLKKSFKAGPPWFEFLVIFDFFAPWYRRGWEASSVKSL